MTPHATHPEHPHRHGDDCGHASIGHEGHTDYLHGGHLHRPHDDHVDEHSLPAAEANPAACTPRHACAAHGGAHAHGGDCGHEPVPHAEHIDYLVDGHLHHPHRDHCDDHGLVRTA